MVAGSGLNRVESNVGISEEKRVEEV